MEVYMCVHGGVYVSRGRAALPSCLDGQLTALLSSPTIAVGIHYRCWMLVDPFSWQQKVAAHVNLWHRCVVLNCQWHGC